MSINIIYQINHVQCAYKDNIDVITNIVHIFAALSYFMQLKKYKIRCYIIYNLFVNQWTK